jgi:hypothetical protein
MTQAAMALGGFVIAVVMWRIAAVDAEPVAGPRGGRWWAFLWVSTMSAISAAAMAQLMPARPATAGFVLFAAVAPGLASIDLRTLLLPFPILAVLTAAALVVFSVDAWWSGSARNLERAVICGLVVAVLGWVWWKAVGEGVGLGDVALFGVVGLYLGWLSVVAVWTGLAIACTLAWVALVLSRIGRGPNASLVPMGPPILAGWWVATALAANGGM